MMQRCVQIRVWNVKIAKITQADRAGQNSRKKMLSQKTRVSHSLSQWWTFCQSRRFVVQCAGTENTQNPQKNTSPTYPISKKSETNSKSPFQDCQMFQGKGACQTPGTAETPSSLSFTSAGSPPNGHSSSSSSVMTPRWVHSRPAFSLNSNP